MEKENIDLQMKIQLQQQRIKAAEDQQEAMKQRESKEKQELEKRVKEEKEESEEKMQSFLDEAKMSERTWQISLLCSFIFLTGICRGTQQAVETAKGGV